MISPPLLPAFQIILILVASMHCAVDHEQVLRRAVAWQQQSSVPQPHDNPCHEAGCLCKGAIFGQEFSFSLPAGESLGQLGVVLPNRSTIVDSQRVTAANWLANLDAHGALNACAHLQAYLL
jgi:hypothetical protein